MEEITNGCLGLGAKETDYILTAGLLNSLPKLYLQDETIFQYNQGKQDWSENSCTLFSPIGAVSSLFNVEIPLDTIKIWDTDSYGKGRVPGEGWWVSMGVDHITKEWNNSEFGKKYGKVAYYSIDLKDDELVKGVLDKRYAICTGYSGNAKYNNDKNDNGILDGTSFGARTYGHAVQSIRSTKYPARIQDNYYGTSKYNIYEVAHKFSEIACFYEKGYVLTKVAEDNLEEIKRLNEFRTIAIRSIEDLGKMWHLTNDEKFRNELHKMANEERNKLKDIENQMKIIS